MKDIYYYTNAEIAAELGISKTYVDAIAKRIYGNMQERFWSLESAKTICYEIRNTINEREQKRIDALKKTVEEVFGEWNLPIDKNYLLFEEQEGTDAEL